MGSRRGNETSKLSDCSSKNKIEEEKPGISEIATAIGVVAGAGLALWGLTKLFGGSEPEEIRKLMKAPGRDGFIFRDDFERDPAAYFRELRK